MYDVPSSKRRPDSVPTSDAWSPDGANDVPSSSRATLVPGSTTTWPCFITGALDEELDVGRSLNTTRGMAIATAARERTLMPPITLATTAAADAPCRYDRIPSHKPSGPQRTEATTANHPLLGGASCVCVRPSSAAGAVWFSSGSVVVPG